MMKPFVKTLPHSIEAEQGVLGSLLIDPQAAIQVLDRLAPEDFYRDAHAIIYRVMAEAARHGAPADFLIVCDVLEQRGQLESVGGASAIAALVEGVPTSGHVDAYADMVRSTALHRRLIAEAGRLAASAYEATASPHEVLAAHLARLLALDDAHRRETLQNHRDGLSAYMQKLDVVYEQHRRGGATITGLPSGFPTLDTLTGGFQRGDLITLAARPSVGKSAMALNLARHFITWGATGFFFSLEMSREQLWQRLLSDASGIDQARLRIGDIDERVIQVGSRSYDGEWPLLVECFETLASTPGTLLVEDTSRLSPFDMRQAAQRWLTRGPLDFLIVDYLQLAAADAPTSSSGGWGDGFARGRIGGGHENRVQEVSAITKGLKRLARDLDVPVIALAQLSRASEGIEPQLSHLKESGSIEEDSDVVCMMWLEEEARHVRAHHTGREPMPPYPVEFKIAKQRKGAVGEVPMRFLPWMTRFEERYARSS